MKGKDLLKLLEGKENFEIKLYEPAPSDKWPTFKTFDLTLSDIGFSEKIITLEKVEV